MVRPEKDLWQEYCEHDDCDWELFTFEPTWLEQCPECGRYSREQRRAFLDDGVLVIEEEW